MKHRGLWACHLGPELGGQGYGQVKLALMNEILGRSRSARSCSAARRPTPATPRSSPTTARRAEEALARAAARNEIVSCYSMTEPQGGADPKVFTTRAVLDGDEWVINGEKWFSSNARYASFLIVMAVTDPEAPPYRRLSMFIVPRDTGRRDHPQRRRRPRRRGGAHAYVRYNDVRVPEDHLLGAPARASSSRRRASAAAASTTPCAPSPRSARRST